MQRAQEDSVGRPFSYMVLTESQGSIYSCWRRKEGGINAGGGSRTHTSVKTLVFETSAYAIPPLQLEMKDLFDLALAKIKQNTTVIADGNNAFNG